MYRLKSSDASDLSSFLGVSPEVTQRTSFKMSSCRYNFYCDVAGGNSFYVGMAPNYMPYNKFEVYIRIEFNPAKLKHDPFLSKVLSFLNSHTWVSDRVVKRFDLAIDFPIARERVSFRKDNRIYKEYTKSAADKTQYLGTHNAHGFIKLYNKALEQKKEGDLTRLEITIDYELRGLEEVRRLIPEIYLLNDYQFEQKITGTDKVLLIAILGDLTLLQELPQVKKKKIASFLEKMRLPLDIEVEKYNSVLDEITNLIK